MEISLKNSYGYTEVVIVAENVKIEEDISENIYALKEDGTKDFNKRIGKDIKDEYLSQFVRLLDDMIYYREKEFDSSELITRLFDKLPSDKIQSLLTELTEQHS